MYLYVCKYTCIYIYIIKYIYVYMYMYTLSFTFLNISYKIWFFQREIEDFEEMESVIFPIYMYITIVN
jgi:hypothetical protein